MKRFLSILMIILLLLTFISCDDTPEKSNEDEGQNSSQSDDQGGGSQNDDQGGGEGQGGGGSQPDPTPKATFTVTFIQEDADPIIETYEEGDPLWLHAPKLRRHNMADFYYYNWDKELDVEVTSNMTVTRTENEGHAAFFMNVDEQTIKIIGRAEWTTLPVADFPALPEIEGFIGVWDQEGDIGYFSSARTDILCWYHSTETYSTGLPKSFIVYGGDAFTISEYPIQVSGSTLKYVNKTNFDLASYGMTGVNSDEAASMINGISPSATDYEEKTYCEKTDWLIQNLPDASRLINAIKVMRDQTEDDGWSIPTAGYCRYIGYALYALKGEDNYFSYLSKDLTRVRFLNSDRFYLGFDSVTKWMDYSFMEDAYASYGMAFTGWNFSSGSFTGYLWPIKPITVE